MRNPGDGALCGPEGPHRIAETPVVGHCRVRQRLFPQRDGRPEPLGRDRFRDSAAVAAINSNQTGSLEKSLPKVRPKTCPGRLSS
jgi:hypothetical protein